MKTIKLLAIAVMSALTLSSCDEDKDDKKMEQTSCEKVTGQNHALLVIDMQNDFCDVVEGYKSALPVTGGTSVIPYINELIKCDKFSVVAFSKDWHDMGHVSFESTYKDEPNRVVVEEKTKLKKVTLDDGSIQYVWPDHCVPNTKGSEIHKDVAFDKDKHFVVNKGTNLNVDSYSAFLDNNKVGKTGLDKYLKEQGITEVTVVGLALDYCVKFTCLDAIALGYKVNLHIKGTKPVVPALQDAVIKQLKEKGVNVIE